MSPDLLRRAMQASSKRVARLERQVVQAAKTYVWTTQRPLYAMPKEIVDHRAQAVTEARLELYSVTLEASRELERWCRLYQAEREARVYAMGSEPPRDPASPGRGTQSPTGRPK